MKISIRKKLLFFTFIFLAGNGVIGYAVFKYNQKHLDSEQKVHHTEQIIFLSGNILSLVKDIESASRGFVITNDSTFLEPLFNAEKTIFLYNEKLRELILNNPKQQQRMDSLNLYLHKRLNFSYFMNEVRSKQGLQAAIAVISTGQGRRCTDTIRLIVDAIQREETILLYQQNQTNAHFVTALGRFTVVMFVLMIVFTILLLITIRNYLYQNEEKEKRAAELAIANKELTFQNEEKEKRAAELSIANKELAFQNQEKEKRAEELTIANEDLTTLTFVSSHDLQEPLRKIKNFVGVLLNEEEKKLSDEGKNYLKRTYETANEMQVLLENLLKYSRTKTAERKFEKTDLSTILEEVKKDFEEAILKKKATIEVGKLCESNIIRFQFRQLFQNLISNSLKFSKSDTAPYIIIKSEIVNGSKLNNVHLNDKVGQKKISPEINYCHIIYTDNGIGFDPQYNERIFEILQRLHSKEKYKGAGLGLATCKRIVENHNGIITATGKLNKGARFDIYIPIT